MPLRLPTPLTLRIRATVAWGVIALVLSSGLATVAYQLTRDRLVDERQDVALTQAYLNARLVRNALRTSDADVSDVLSSLETNAQTVVIARVGADWFSSSVGVGPGSLPASLADLVSDGSAGHQRFRLDDAATIAVGVPIPAVDARYFELRSMDDVERTLNRLARGLVVAATLATVAAAFAGWYGSGRVLRPLRTLAAAATRIADGDLDTRLETFGDRDLRPLEQAFNRMADAVQERIDREARFTSDVSHELRSPIAVMMSALHIARRSKGDPEAAENALDDLEGRVVGLHKLVEDLLEISRVEAGVAHLQLEPVEPAGLARAVLHNLGKEDIDVELRGPVDAPVLLDKRRVGQMLQNLLDNADRYAGGATRVEVAAEDGTVRFTVDDHGPGIAPHEQRYVFERFARGDAAATTGAEGTGLGLALVAEHAALHGGRVHVEDAPGGGARFVIELPRKEADAS